MNCAPCKRTFVQTAELLQRLRKETLSPETQVACRTLAAALEMTGHYIVDQEIAQVSRATYKEP